MKDTATSRRVQRGIVLAASGAAEAHSDQYRVNGRGGTYLVDLDRQYCSCPDQRRRGGTCKHLAAAQVVDSREACRRRKTARPKRVRHDSDDSLRGIVADAAALDRVADRVNV